MGAPVEMIEFEHVDATPVVRLRGDIDMSNINTIEATIADRTSNAEALVVDLTDVTYLDSAGVRLLYHLDTRLRGRNRTMFIVVPPDAPASRTIEASGAVGSLRIVKSLPEAVAAIERP